MDVAYADFCRFAIGVPMSSLAPRPGGEESRLLRDSRHQHGHVFYQNFRSHV
jgi:hypothetical protein